MTEEDRIEGAVVAACEFCGVKYRRLGQTELCTYTLNGESRRAPATPILVPTGGDMWQSTYDFIRGLLVGSRPGHVLAIKPPVIIEHDGVRKVSLMLHVYRES